MQKESSFSNIISDGFYLSVLITFCLLFFSGSFTRLHAQPANDNFAKAEEIKVTGNGYDKGTFISSKVNITKATKEAGESFHLLQYYAGTDKKTVWFYFETQLRRNVTIELKQQDTLIAQDGAGLTVYKTQPKTQPPNLGEVEATLTPVSKFGSTTNTCLAPGKYFIQVSAKQNANAEIWVNVKVEDANPAPYDLPKNAYNFGTMSGTKNIAFDVGCQAIDNLQEIHPILGKDYNQTTWATFTTDNYSDAISLTFTVAQKLAGPDTIIMGYRLYKGDASMGVSTLQPEDSFIFQRACNTFNPSVCGQIGIRNYHCKLLAKTTYTVQLFFHKDAQYKFNFWIDEMGEELSRSANPQSLPGDYQLGELKNNTTFTVKDRFACNSLLKNNLCGSVIPSAFVTDTAYISNNIPYIDTFDLSLWFTFEVTKTGSINFEARNKICNNQDDYSRYLYRVFAGDVTKNCSLKLVMRRAASGYRYLFNGSLCLEPGVYSFQALGRTVRNGNATVCSQVDLGKYYEMQVRFTEEVSQTAATHFLPSNPEDLGDITAKLPSGVKSKQDYFGSPDDSFRIGNALFRGRFIYRQFYISQPTFITIYEDRNLNYYTPQINWIFTGKISNGRDSVELLQPDSLYIKNWFRGSNSPYNSLCTPLPAGWYTLVSYVNISCSNKHYPYANFINLRSSFPCQKKYNRPYKAHVANSGVQLDFNSTPNASEETYRIFTFDEDCMGCSTDTPFSAHPVPACLPNNTWQKPYNRSSYYVFSLKRESHVKITVNSYINASASYNVEYQLFSGDVRQDSLHLMDSARQMLSCTNTGEFCRMKPGTYTIVVFGNNNINVQPVIRVERMGRSAYDFASNAYDFGFIPGGAEWKTAPTDYIYCTTGAFATDPDTNHNTFRNSGLTSSIPYPMVENYLTGHRSISSYRRRNLWYTFTCKGAGKIIVTSIPKFENTNARYSMYIYRSDERGSISFNELKSTGKIDSTNKQGLVLVASNYFNNDPAYYNTNTIQFEKLGCDTARYYVVVDRNTNTLKEMVNQLQVNVKYHEHGTYGEKADHCTNAEEITMNAPGKKSGTLLINCHTKGEGFGEDGSNMGCMVQDGMKYKTSWFKYIYTGTQRVDLSFSIYESSSAHPTEIRYRVLYGTCKAMTPGPCVDNAYSSFKLDCMGAGEYYVQVVSPEGATGTISVEVNATPTTYPICKPADLLKPLANFSYKGGCNNEPVQFINLSSAGEDVSYFWDFGNTVKSKTAKDTIIQYAPVKAIDTFKVTLIVLNNSVNKYDSLTIPVLVFRDPVKAKVKQKNFYISCAEKIKLEAESNYPFSTFEWSPKEGLSNPYIANPEVIPGKGTFYVVTVKAENCIMQDTVFIHIINKKIITGDTVICVGHTSTLKAPDGFSYYRWVHLPTNTYTYTQNLPISLAGKYVLYASAPNACYSYDTINVSVKSGIDISLGKDTSLCAGQKLLLQPDKPGKFYMWSTGETTPAIFADKPGIYWLRMHIHDTLCDAVDTIVIKPAGQQFSLGKDTAICPGTSFLLKPDITGVNYLWSTGETSASIIINKPGKYWLRINSPDNCSTADTILVTERILPSIEIPEEIFICGNLPAVLSLENKPVQTYLWSNGATSSTATFTKAGKYFVTVSENGCQLTDSFEVKNAAAPVSNLKNDTTICGDFILLLDAGEGMKYLWQPGGQQDRFLTVNSFGRYIVKVSTQEGCEMSDTINIKELCLPTLFVPNAFTPGNNDFLNNVFKAVGQHITYFDLRIHDRWGERIFQTHNLDEGWDGTYRGRDCQMDVYLWTVEYRGKGVTKYLSGTVTLLR